MNQKYQKYIILTLSSLIIAFYSIFEHNLDYSKEGVSDSYARVARVIDGDTFDIETGERIRMIGIDTPERGKEFYKEAKKRLEELIYDREVELVKDVSETDRYGRLLRHVYVDDVWINKQMIDEGFARFVTFPPDVMHVDVFRKAEQDARDGSGGLWSKD